MILNYRFLSFPGYAFSLHCFWPIPDSHLFPGNRIYDLFPGVRAVEPRLPKILSTYGRKRFSHIEVGMGSGVPRLTRMPGRNEHA